MIGGWMPLLFKSLHLAATVVAPVAVGLSVVWLFSAAMLGRLWDREHKKLSR